VFLGTNLIKVEKRFPAGPGSRGIGLVWITLLFVHRQPRAPQGLCHSQRLGAQHLGDPLAKAREAHAKSHIRDGTFELECSIRTSLSKQFLDPSI